METGKAIYKLLKDSTDVGDICADRIYPELAQQDADAPFIVYTVVDTTPSPTKNATSKLDTARVELYCLSDDYEQAMDLGIAVRSALDRQSGTIAGVEVQSIDFDTSDIQFDPDQRIYVLEHTYDVRVQRTGTAQVVSQFPGNTFTVEEVDGDPTGAVNKLVVSNGSLSIDGNTATIQTGGNVTSVNTQTGDVVLDTDDIAEGATNEYYTDAKADARIAAADITDLNDTPGALGTSGQVLAVNSGGTALEFVDQETVDTQYHGRYDTQAETLRSGATGDVEFYYTARPDGDGTAESEISDEGVTDTINRTLAYSTKHRADPDTVADWTDYTTQPADNASFATAKAALLAGLNETDATAETRGTLPVSLKMTRTTTAAVTDLLLDTYSGAAAAYSVRKLSKDYTGNCMRIRRDSDQATQDIGFDGNGDLDTAAIATFCTGAFGYVTRWYDQSGNGNDATQNTAGSQPIIYDRVAAAVVTENGKPALDFLGLNNPFRLTSSFSSASQPNTAVVISTLATDVVNNNKDLIGLDGSINNSMLFSFQQNNYTPDEWQAYAGTLYQTNTASDGNQNIHFGLFNGASSAYHLNGTSIGSGDFGSASVAGLSIGSNAANQAHWAGTIQEVIFYPSDQSSNRTGIETNIDDYFSIT
jgi:hypothetical protein